MGRIIIRCPINDLTERRRHLWVGKRSRNVWRRHGFGIGGAGRRYKKIILDEFCATWEYNRKYAIDLLNAKARKRRGRRGRPARYGRQEHKVLEQIWLVATRPCSRRLQAMLAAWLPFYEQRHGSLDRTTKTNLLQISKNSIDRLLKPTRRRYGTHGRCGTRPGTQLLHQIPIKTSHWKVSEPGFMQADTVAHGGDSMEGDFVHSLTFTDICSGWTENRATWNKGAQGVLTQLRELEESLPFPIQGFHSDNGKEFLNHHLYRYYSQRKEPIGMSRGRPRQGNDSAQVEQKNWSHVRLLLGYQRLDDPSLVPKINELYRLWDAFNNFFCTNLKLIEKTKVGSRYQKKYDIPQKPYQRKRHAGHL
ncbi:MAG: transposase family protein [Lentisphaerae bacterium]|nr:transposase family protein [Lentisphaerota bacterium]